MKTEKISHTDLCVVTDRPQFLSEVRRMVGAIEGVRVNSVPAAPRPEGLTACLSVLEGQSAAVLLVDGETDPASALQLVQGIFDHSPSPRVFLAGRPGDSDLILRSQRAGASEFLPLPLDARTLMDAIHRLWKRVAPEAAPAAHRRGRVLTFLGAKGGCGTTTLAVNLAVTLAGRGRSTLLIDLDLSAGDAALLLNLAPAFSVADVVQNSHRLDRELLNGMLLKHSSGLQILAASENPERSEGIEPARMGQILKFLREQFDYVVVNTGDLEHPATQAALAQADLIHLVASLDLLALRRGQWCLRRLEQSGISRDLLRLVLNRHDRNPYISPEEAEKVLDLKVSWTVPLENRSIPEALNEGVPFVIRSRNGLAASFEGYAATLAPAVQASPAGPRRKVLGLFSSRAAARPHHHGATA